MAFTHLFSDYMLPGGMKLKNRLVMAPMTRCFADDELAPTEAMLSYYQARAEAGLIITEATLVEPRAQGYPRTPGIYSDRQVHAWSGVVDAVHEAGGLIFCQLWHTGRMAHSHYTGKRPMAPGAVGMEGSLPRAPDLSYEIPLEMEVSDIETIQTCYVDAARNAIKAGFDEVELHGANGYLIDQFLHQQTNQRGDDYGGNPVNRSRFILEVLDKTIAAAGAYRVGIRLSPQAYINLDYTPGDEETFNYLLEQLNTRRLAYVHVAAFDAQQHYDYLGGRPVDYVRKHYTGTVIGCGGYTPMSAENEIHDRRMDLVAFGRPFIANPDLPGRIRNDEEALPYDESMLQSLR
ncbi:MAG TPA: alkene reductase [Gammaproteobacteria bacterium]|nr:alkene reductase [Gammaproteobacteria bacterium]